MEKSKNLSEKIIKTSIKFVDAVLQSAWVRLFDLFTMENNQSKYTVVNPPYHVKNNKNFSKSKKKTAKL